MVSIESIYIKMITNCMFCENTFQVYSRRENIISYSCLNKKCIHKLTFTCVNNKLQMYDVNFINNNTRYIIISSHYLESTNLYKSEFRLQPPLAHINKFIQMPLLFVDFQNLFDKLIKLSLFS